MFNKVSNAARYALRCSSYSVDRMLRLEDDISFQFGAMIVALIAAAILVKICGVIAGWIA